MVEITLANSAAASAAVFGLPAGVFDGELDALDVVEGFTDVDATVALGVAGLAAFVVDLHPVKLSATSRVPAV